MLRHIALFRWADGVTAAQRQDLVDGLTPLPSLVPEIRNYQFGPNLGLVEGNWDFAIVADFDDEAAWRRYTDNADHQRAISEHIRPLLGERAAVQYEI